MVGSGRHVKGIGEAADEVGVSQELAVGVDPETARRDVEDLVAPGVV